MDFLRKEDYYSQIQSDNLTQVIEKNDRYRIDAEGKALAEMDSYIAQRYLSEKVFRAMVDYDVARAYLYGERFLYSVDSLALEKDIYYIKNPLDYESDVTYSVGSRVLYSGSVYQCAVIAIDKVPTNTTYWTLIDTLELATITAGVTPTDTTLVAKGDNRNQALVMYLIDMTLYHLHCRINPRNVPDIRPIRYNGNNATENGGAIGWLKKVAKGEVSVNLDKIVPTQGSRVTYGSNAKQTHNY